MPDASNPADLLAPFRAGPMDGLAFCQEAFRALEEAKSTPEGLDAVRRLKGPAKKLIEEILPLAAFAHARYAPGFHIRVEWVDGNQPYDARIYFTGKRVEFTATPPVQHAEVTIAEHSKEYLKREAWATEGGGFGPHGSFRDSVSRKAVTTPTALESREELHACLNLIRERILDKLQKPYPVHTTLVVGCRFGLLTSDEWAVILAGLRSIQHPFREVLVVDVEAWKVFTVDSVGDTGTEVY